MQTLAARQQATYTAKTALASAAATGRGRPRPSDADLAALYHQPWMQPSLPRHLFFFANRRLHQLSYAASSRCIRMNLEDEGMYKGCIPTKPLYPSTIKFPGLAQTQIPLRPRDLSQSVGRGLWVVLCIWVVLCMQQTQEDETNMLWGLGQEPITFFFCIDGYTRLSNANKQQMHQGEARRRWDVYARPEACPNSANV